MFKQFFIIEQLEFLKHNLSDYSKVSYYNPKFTNEKCEGKKV